MKTLLIIPAYNEEESLKRTIDAVRAEAPSVDFLVVNDGSQDGTERVCRENQYPFLDLATNLGLAGAFQTGLKYAYRHDYDCAIQFDADGQHLPKYIEELAQATKIYDIAIGSRFLGRKKPHSLRMFGSDLIQWAIKVNKRMIAYIANGLNYGPEPDTVSYLIKRAGAKVVEVPVEMQERQAGESYLRPWSSAMYMMRMAISILFIQFFRKKIDGDGR